MKQHLSLLLIPTLVLTLIAGGIWLWLKEPSMPPLNLTEDVPEFYQTTQSVEAEGLVCSQEQLQMRWQLDARQMYDVDLQVRVDVNVAALLSDDAAAYAPSQTSALEVKGTLNFRVLDQQEHQVLVAMQLSPVSVTSNGRKIDSLQKLYASMFMVTFAKTGALETAHFPKSFSVTDQESLMGLLRTLQVQMPDYMIARGDSWQTEESDTLGVYEAAYQVSENHCDTVRKSKGNYSHINHLLGGNQNGKSPFSSDVPQSILLGTFEPGSSWLSQAWGVEQLQVLLEDTQVLQSQSRVSLKQQTFLPNLKLDIWQDPLEASTLLATLNALGQGKQTGHWEKQQQDHLQQRYVYASVDEFYEAIHQMVLKGKPMAKKGPLINKLKDYFIAYPEVSLEVPEMLKRQNAPKEASASFMLALELAGHAQAQQALASVMKDDEHSRMTRLQAIAAAGDIQEPEPELLEELWQLGESGFEERSSESLERSGSAFLALGHLSSVLDENGQQADSDHIVHELTERLEKAEYQSDQLLFIEALGNTHSEKLPDVLEPYFQSEQPVFRRKALTALRYVKTPEVETKLLHHLEKDIHPSVRTEAFEVLERQDASSPHVIQRFSQQIAQESDSVLKKKLIQYVGPHVKTSANARQALEQELQKQPSEAEAKALYRALYQ